MKEKEVGVELEDAKGMLYNQGCSIKAQQNPYPEFLEVAQVAEVAIMILSGLIVRALSVIIIGYGILARSDTDPEIYVPELVGTANPMISPLGPILATQTTRSTISGLLRKIDG